MGFRVSVKASQARTWTVDDDGPADFSTIQEAINNATDGDTIFVYNGTYYENVVVNKSLSLVGQDRDLTIIDGSRSGRVISITANHVNVNGFTIQKSGEVYDSGIFVDHSSNNNISCNTITNNGIGIYLYYTSGNVVSNNTVSNNNYGIWLDYSGNNALFNNNMCGNTYNFGVYGDADSHFDNSVDVSNTIDARPVYYLKGVTNNVYDAQTSAGTFYLINCNNITIKDITPTKNEYGVFLWHTTNSKIENVTASNNNYGISLYYSSNNVVSGNIVLNNNYGIYLWGSSHSNVVSGNTASSNNEDGIKLSYSSDNNVVSDNTAFSNGIYGIYLSSCSNNTVSGNTVSSNEYEGIYLSRSSGNVVSGNTALKNWDGISICYYSSGNVVSGNSVFSNNYAGIGLYYFSSNNVVSGNTASSNNEDGIKLSYSSDNNVVSDNIVSNNNYGIWLYISSNNSLSGNTVSNNNDGVGVCYSSNNTIYHNNFINNTGQVTPGSINDWDDGYEGNYWSDYIGIDSDGDGIGDVPYVIDVDNQDSYPLMGLFSDFNVISEHHVTVICNSTISDFKFDQVDKAIRFDVTGEDGTIGFCRICIPTALMDTYAVFVNGTEVSYTLLPCSNSTQSYLYFIYGHSTQEVIIMPTIFSDYYELLGKYVQLLADFRTLNSTYYELSSEYSELLIDHSSLNSTYYTLLFNYNNLNSTYYTLLSNYTELQGNYDSLLTIFDSLHKDFNTLNSTYNDLQVSYNELQSDQGAIIHELSNMRNYMYVFIAIMVFIAATVYLTIKTKMFKGKP